MNVRTRISCGLSVATLLTIAPMAYGQWVNEQLADLVVGKGTFTDTTEDGPSSSRINVTHGIAIDAANGKMYLGDTTRHRVLRYAYPITSNGQAAELVFGQVDFTTVDQNAGGISASSLSVPLGVAVDSTGRLIIADQGNNRVLTFDNAHLILSNKPSANRVLGQADFVSNSTATAQDRMNAPVAACVDGSGDLWIADRNNNRVLRFTDVANLANGANASLVLGQSTFTTAGSGNGTTGMNTPGGVARIANSLFVGDSLNHRVLRFDNIDVESNGGAADVVLGQTSFTNTTAGTAQDRLYNPRGLALDLAGRLYVADEQNHRVVMFNDAVSKITGANADFVLGQPDFVTRVREADQQSMGNPIAVSVDSVNNVLGVAEYWNKRATIFNASGGLPVSLSTVEIE